MRWIVRAKHKKFDEHWNLVNSDLEVYYDGRFKFIAWLVYKCLSKHSFPYVVMCNQAALEIDEGDPFALDTGLLGEKEKES